MTDRVLAYALVQSADMRCPGCGHPKHESWNPHSSGWYELREADCEGCAPVDRAAEGDKKPRPGHKRWTEDVRPIDVELPEWTPAGATRVGAGAASAGAAAGTGPT